MNPSITAPMSPAWSRMITVLFRPFHLGKWFCMGFAAWLMTLAETSSNTFSNGIELPFHFFPGPAADDHTVLTAGIIGGLCFLVLVVIIVFIWLSARGRFIFLYQLINDRTEIQKPWSEFRDVAHSFFFWNLGLAFIILVAAAVPAGGAVFFFYPLFDGAPVDPMAQVLGITCIVLILLLCIPALYAWFYLAEFIAPMMLRYRCRTGDAIRFFLPALKEHTASMLVFPLFRAMISTGIIFLLIAIGFLTCCIGLILLAIPYLGSVMTLPITFFLTGYSLEYLKSLGPEYDAFIPFEEPEAPPERRL